MTVFDKKTLSFDLRWEPSVITYSPGLVQNSSTLFVMVKNNSRHLIEKLTIGVSRLPWSFGHPYTADGRNAFVSKDILGGTTRVVNYLPMGAAFDFLSPGEEMDALLYTMQGTGDDHRYYWMAPTFIEGKLASGEEIPRESFVFIKDGEQEAPALVHSRVALRFNPKRPDLFPLEIKSLTAGMN